MSTIVSNKSHQDSSTAHMRDGVTRLPRGRRFKFPGNSLCIVGQTIERMSFSPLLTPHRTRDSQADVFIFPTIISLHPDRTTPTGRVKNELWLRRHPGSLCNISPRNKHPLPVRLTSSKCKLYCALWQVVAVSVLITTYVRGSWVCDNM